MVVPLAQLDLGYIDNTFTTMYNNGVVPVLYNGSSICGYSSKNCQADLVQHKAVRYYLGVHNFTPVPGLLG